jgi:phosphoribosyl-dephospho-CoA transferase
MRMRQSLAELEATVFEQLEEEKKRAERLRAEAERRTRQRQALKTHKRGSMRFGLLVLTLIATAVIVTIAMFQALYYLLG